MISYWMNQKGKSVYKGSVGGWGWKKSAETSVDQWFCKYFLDNVASHLLFSSPFHPDLCTEVFNCELWHHEDSYSCSLSLSLLLVVNQNGFRSISTKYWIKLHFNLNGEHVFILFVFREKRWCLHMEPWGQAQVLWKPVTLQAIYVGTNKCFLH